MKLFIATVASIAFAASAFAAVPSAPAKKRAAAMSSQLIELALGAQRHTGSSNSRRGSSNAPAGGKTTFGS